MPRIRKALPPSLLLVCLIAGLGLYLGSRAVPDGAPAANTWTGATASVTTITSQLAVAVGSAPAQAARRPAAGSSTTESSVQAPAARPAPPAPTVGPATTRETRTPAITPVAARRGRYPTIEVWPLPGWPKWVGDVNHQISGLAFREGRLYGVSDQSGVEKRAILELALDEASAHRKIPVRVVCRWKGGPNPDVEGLAIDPSSGSPRFFLMPLETDADVVVEVRAGDCEYEGALGPLSGNSSNEGIEGIALSPDGETLYFAHETRRTLSTLARGADGPARVIAKLSDADSLCDIAYDDAGTTAVEDDGLLLLDRNDRQIFATTLGGEITGRWKLLKGAVQIDPDGASYRVDSLEAMAIEAREPDGSIILYAATDTPPRPYPYRRRDGEDPNAAYLRRVGMLYRFKLPPFVRPPAPASGGLPPRSTSHVAGSPAARLETRVQPPLASTDTETAAGRSPTTPTPAHEAPGRHSPRRYHVR